jgi:hypothetical protein
MNDALLVDRAVRELLNSIAVMGDLVQYRKRRHWARRLIVDKVSGQEQRIADLMDDHVSHSVDNFLTLMTELAERIELSDETMTKLIYKSQFVEEELAEQAIRIRDEFDSLEKRLSNKLHVLGHRIDARDSIEFGFSELNAAAQNGSLGLVELWKFTEELWWGGFGMVQRDSSQVALATRTREEVLNRIKTLFKDRVGYSGLIPMKPLLTAIKPASEGEREVIDLLALDPRPKARPLTSAILARSLDRVDEKMEDSSTPALTTIEHLAERFLEEARRGAK